MRADTPTINGIIQNDILLKVPFFQRRYVWDEDNWERFANDMESTLESNRKYFLGAIILKEESYDTYPDGISSVRQIIDGQQRLTTLAIYMKVLHMRVGKSSAFSFQYLRDNSSKDPIIDHGCEDRVAFTNIMHLDTATEIPNAKDNISKAYNYFLRKLNPQKIVLNDLLNSVKSKVTFVMITLQNEDDEQQIFDTINSLGEPLTTGDLIKNFLYKSEDEDAYKSNWKPVFDDDSVKDYWNSYSSKTRQSLKKEDKTIERFFHAFVRIKMWDFKSRLTEIQKKEFVKIDNVFRTCQAFVNDLGMNRQDLANEIIEYAKLYKQNLNADILNDRIPQHSGIKRVSCLINGTKTYSAIPYVLYILHEVNDESERNKIFGYLECYLVRRILAGSSNNSYSDLFTENLIANSTKDYDSFKTYIENRDSQLAMPNLSKLKLSMNAKGINELSARIILYMYETKLTKTSDPNSLDGGFVDYFAEQLMPKLKNSQNWPGYRKDSQKEDNRQTMIGTLGNFFLLENGGKKDMKKNIDSPCQTKVGVMKLWSNNIRSINQLLGPGRNTPISTWTEQEISARNDSMARLFDQEIWPIN